MSKRDRFEIQTHHESDLPEGSAERVAIDAATRIIYHRSTADPESLKADLVLSEGEGRAVLNTETDTVTSEELDRLSRIGRSRGYVEPKSELPYPEVLKQTIWDFPDEILIKEGYTPEEIRQGREAQN
jgi:hypothetical protein